MRYIWPDSWSASKHAFDFRQSDTMLLAFGLVAFIPIKTGNIYAIHGEGWHLYVRLSTELNGGLLSAHVSSGGHRLSGIGRERGEEGLRLYQNITCLNIGG